MINLTVTTEQLHTVLSWGLVQADVHFYTVELWPMNYYGSLGSLVLAVTVLRSENA